MKKPIVKLNRGSTLFLKGVICLIAIGVLTSLFWFPQTEGRATNLDLISIYTDPFIIYIYIASIPFFVALFQTIKLLRLIEHNKAFSQASVNVLRNIKYCVLATISFIVIAEAIIIFLGPEDDKAGPIALGIYAIFASIVIATGVAVFQKLLQNAVDIKSENDLTV